LLAFSFFGDDELLLKSLLLPVFLLLVGVTVAPVGTLVGRQPMIPHLTGQVRRLEDAPHGAEDLLCEAAVYAVVVRDARDVHLHVVRDLKNI
jgi:hypothetical protein